MYQTFREEKLIQIDYKLKKYFRISLDGELLISPSNPLLCDYWRVIGLAKIILLSSQALMIQIG